MRKWYTLVEAYSRRQLTVKTDKLPAVSGVAAEVAHMLGSADGSAYAAGLWKGDILRGLAWFFHPMFCLRVAKGDHPWPPGPADEGIPSWSWAAFDGSVMHYGQGWSKLQAPTVLSVETLPVGVDPFGRVMGGRIRLTGWTFEAQVSEAHLRLYFDSDPEELPSIAVVCLMLGNGLSPRRVYGDVGLVLMKDGQRQRRVGMFDVEASDRKWVKGRRQMTVEIE
ncbi:hypothetical protein N656DRAFT_801398 [Canariomyces notabilis]|uniref:Uncharacterized protein n=1 Tax=Canariomyces notabilis TaxID=2074819 RepID=A0AAN6QL04_9PEZI|nr:hypothetical protein N656DRAFT_801398 [Canariomyces arenarius]